MWNIYVITGGHPGACACLWLGEQLPLHWGHCQGHGAGALTNRRSLALCPSSCSVPGPGSLSRASALWEKMLRTSLWFLQCHGPGFCGKGLKWEGCRSSFCKQQLPHFGQSPFQAAQKQSHSWPKLCPSGACSWLWGKGREVDNEALGSWKYETKASLLCTLLCQHTPAGWGCTGGCKGTQRGNWPPLSRGISHSMWCHAQQSNHGDRGWQGLPWLRNWLGISLLFFLGFKVVFSLFFVVFCLFGWLVLVWFCFNLVKLLLSQPTSVFLPFWFSPPGLGSEWVAVWFWAAKQE